MPKSGVLQISSLFLKPENAESVKIDIQPTLEEPKVNAPSYNYTFPNVSYKPKSVYSPINPVFVKPEKENRYCI